MKIEIVQEGRGGRRSVVSIVPRPCYGIVCRKRHCRVVVGWSAGRLGPLIGKVVGGGAGAGDGGWWVGAAAERKVVPVVGGKGGRSVKVTES